ncbi:MAG: hypothetical protein GX309_13275 [Clostridiales bacterium]|nr:hypothetical protein [Clostridiales bacterium]
MVLQLSKTKVIIKDTFTWGDKERLQNVYIKGAKIDQTGMKDFDTSVVSEAKYVLMEIMIEAIDDENGKRTVFTREWVNNLSPEDGDLLYSTIEEITKPKKKV